MTSANPSPLTSPVPATRMPSEALATSLSKVQAGTGEIPSADPANR